MSKPPGCGQWGAALAVLGSRGCGFSCCRAWALGHMAPVVVAAGLVALWMWDLRFWTKDQTHVPCIGRWIFNHRTTKKFPVWENLYLAFISEGQVCQVKYSWLADFFALFCFIEIWLVYSVVLVAGVQQNDSMFFMYLFFLIVFPFRLFHNIEQSSLCYTVDPCWLSFFSITVCTCQSQAP